MEIAILGPTKSAMSYTTSRYLEEAKKAFGSVQYIPLIDVVLKASDKLEALYGGKSLADFDYIIPKIDSKRASVGYPIIRFLDDMKVKKPYSAQTVLTAHNKFLTLQELVKSGIRVPKTYLTASAASTKTILKKQRMPVMLKLLSGFGGQGVVFIESKDSALSTVNTIKTLRQEICIEEYIENPGEDMRAIVAGNKVIASYRRIAQPGEKKANLYSGGRAESFSMPRQLQSTAVKAAKAMGSKLCAIDMIQGKKHAYVIEVNINFGIRGMEQATGINVAERIMQFVKNEVAK